MKVCTEYISSYLSHDYAIYEIYVTTKCDLAYMAHLHPY